MLETYPSRDGIIIDNSNLSPTEVALQIVEKYHLKKNS